MPDPGKWIQWISRLFHGDRADYQRALSEFSRTLTLIVDFDQLVENLIGKLREIADIPKIYIRKQLKPLVELKERPEILQRLEKMKNEG